MDKNVVYCRGRFNTPALRVSEALNVRFKDLNLEKKEINVIGGKKRKDNDISNRYHVICRY